MRIRSFVKLLSALCLFAAQAQAQQPAKPLPAFDAASVRRFALPAGGWAWGPPKIDPVHLRMPGSPLRDIILKAYGLDDFQLTGVPDWASHEFFTIDAVTDKPTPPDQMLLMLRRLLADRFQLQIEESEKEQPVWAIVPARGGPKLKPRADDEECPRGISGDDMKAAGAPPNSSSSFSGCVMADLVKAFNRRDRAKELGRPVIDKTGLTGRYHMLVWQENEQDATYTGPGMRMSYVEPFREAVEKELGLKLVEDKQNLHFIKVLNVTRPGPN
ncbi:MAG TPA: TIGR03435 family protein [Acidobacteriaceae bacterium]|nr:TIGR03435 family protein [Acidobacteriaceae bacterium]